MNPGQNMFYQFIIDIMPKLKNFVVESGLPKLEEAMSHFASQL